MPKIFCSLFEGAPVRYIHIKSKKAARRPWFFHEDVIVALNVARDAASVPPAWRMVVRLKIIGNRESFDLISLEGMFFLAREADPPRAARFLAFLAANGLGGAA